MRRWHWRDQAVSWSVMAPPEGVTPTGGPATDVVLVHGFGACKEHWRYNQPVLAQRSSCFAIDLVGFGASAKPRSCLEDETVAKGDFRYGLEAWADQVSAFCREVVGKPVTLVGNSIGGVVVLRAAQMLRNDEIAPCRRVILLDAAQRAMDDKRLHEMPLPVQVARPLLRALVSQRWLTERLFHWFARPTLIRRVLLMAYPSGANVDDELVELLHRATRDQGAPESFRGFVNLFNDYLAPDLLAGLDVPVHMIWGESDPWEPVTVSRDWQRFPCVRSFQTLGGLGHCPHDEAPERVNPLLLQLISPAPEQAEGPNPQE